MLLRLIHLHSAVFCIILPDFHARVTTNYPHRVNFGGYRGPVCPLPTRRVVDQPLVKFFRNLSKRNIFLKLKLPEQSKWSNNDYIVKVIIGEFQEET